MKKLSAILILTLIAVGSYLFLNTTKEPQVTVALKSSHVEVIQAELKIRTFKLKRIEYVTNIMQFIKDNGGDIDNFTLIKKLRLAKSLQYCSTLPTGELETLSLEVKLDLAQVQQNDGNSGVHMCKGVLPKLIIESYFILKKIAQEGDMQGINEFNRAMIPELLEAKMANDIDGFSAKTFLESHYLMLKKLLVESIDNGNIDATLKVATYMRIGKRGFDKDLTSSTGYFLAVKSVYNVSSFDKYIKKMSYDLTLAEFKEAEEFAINLTNHWENLVEGVWSEFYKVK